MLLSKESVQWLTDDQSLTWVRRLVSLGVLASWQGLVWLLLILVGLVLV